MDTSSPNSPPGAPERNIEADVVDLVQLMGQSLNMALLYGLTHKVARSSLELSYTVTMKFMEFHGPLHINVTDGALLVNGAATTDAPLAGNFATRLTGLNLFSLSIEPSFPLEEYINLFAVLLTPPAKLGPTPDGAALMQSMGMKSIQAKTFTYRRVDDAAPETPDQIPPPPDMPSAAEKAAMDLDNIMAFLKEDGTADPSRYTKDIRQLAGDSEKLAELILRAIEIRASIAHLAEGESLTDLVVGCIHKVVDQIIKDPAIKTQKDRKHIKRSLLMLEKALLERLQKLAGDHAAKAAESLMDDITGDLDLEDLAGKYMKNKRAVDKVGLKLTRMIERASDDPAQLEELREHLVEEGLTPEGWQELTIRSKTREPEADMGGSGGSEGINEIKVLTLLLARIGETINPPAGTAEPSVPEVHALIMETESHLGTLTTLTEQKITKLKQNLEADDASALLSRKELMKMLAEIAQEISQPLTVVMGTIDMVRSLRTGPLTAIQGELLSMVSESSARMAHLVDCLVRLSGNPDTLHPDPDILESVYSGKLS